MMFHDSTESYQTEDDVQLLLKKEVKFLDKREHLVELYKVVYFPPKMIKIVDFNKINIAYAYVF